MAPNGMNRIGGDSYTAGGEWFKLDFGPTAGANPLTTVRDPAFLDRRAEATGLRASLI